MTTSVCPSVRPPFGQLLPFPPASLTTRSPVKPLPGRASLVAERPWVGSARSRAGIPQQPRCHRAGGRPRSLLLPAPSRLWTVGQHLSRWKTMEWGEGLVPFLPYQLRSLPKQVIFVPTHPTDSSGLNAQAVPSPSCTINNNTGPACQISLVTMAGYLPQLQPLRARAGGGEEESPARHSQARAGDGAPSRLCASRGAGAPGGEALLSGPRDAEGGHRAEEPRFPPPNQLMPRAADEPMGSLSRDLTSPQRSQLPFVSSKPPCSILYK